MTASSSGGANAPERRFRELGEFLRLRREALSPTETGLPPRRRARTTGLRREDVAQAAGVSQSWYTWLEQGRDIRPSLSVLMNIARALRLNQDDLRYMFDLAGQPVPMQPIEPRPAVTPAIQKLLNSIDVPAYVLNERWDRIAWNRPLLTLMGDFSSAPLLERNVVWRAFLDPATRSLPEDWRETARLLLAEFQAGTSRHLHEPWMIDFVASMASASSEFREWWQLRDIVQRREKINVIHHPIAGRLLFEHLSFYPADDPALMLSIFTPVDADNRNRFAHLLRESGKPNSAPRTLDSNEPPV